MITWIHFPFFCGDNLFGNTKYLFSELSATSKSQKIISEKPVFSELTNVGIYVCNINLKLTGHPKLFEPL